MCRTMRKLLATVVIGTVGYVASQTFGRAALSLWGPGWNPSRGDCSGTRSQHSGVGRRTATSWQVLAGMLAIWVAVGAVVVYRALPKSSTHE